MKKLLILMLTVLGCIASDRVIADCYASASSIQDLGAFSSITINSQPIDFTFSSNFTCEGFVNLIDYSQIDATLMSTNYEFSNGLGDAIPYTLYTDAARMDPFLIGETVEFGGFNLLDLLGLFSNTDGSLPLYLTTTPANVPAGIYSDTIAVLWQWDYCSGIGVSGLCIGRDSGSEVISVTLNLTVQNACQLTSQDASFGAVISLNLVHSTLLPANVNCTKNLSYNIYIDGGDNFISGARQMSNGIQTIAYELFAPDGTTPVGPTAIASLTATGSGLNEALIFIARTTTSNSLPPVGLYSDNVRLILNY